MLHYCEMACLRSTWRMIVITTTTCRRRLRSSNVWGSKNSHNSGRSIIHRLWTASLEQPTSPSTWLRTCCLGVLPVAWGRICFAEDSGASDWCFSTASNKCSYLLTYLLTTSSVAVVADAGIAHVVTKCGPSWLQRLQWSLRHHQPLTTQHTRLTIILSVLAGALPPARLLVPVLHAIRTSLSNFDHTRIS